MADERHAVKTSERAVLSGMTLPRLRQWVSAHGMRPFRADQIFKWLHARTVDSFDMMTDISKRRRHELSRIASIELPRPLEVRRSSDGTTKAVLALGDGATVETVLIPEPDRLTACLSTQVGCRMGCVFCQTGLAGFRRQLLTHEIVGQLDWLRSSLVPEGKRVSNVVLMGMGEPLDNTANVLPALEIITSESGACIGSRKITISTIGLPDGIARITELQGQFGLAVSLHSAREEVRSRLVPATRSLGGLQRLRSSMERYTRARGRRVTIEYCLLAGVNDGREDALELAAWTGDLPSKINLIPYNEVAGAGFRAPDAQRVDAFASILYPLCPAVTVRRQRGSDVCGACGQLGLSLLERSPAITDSG